MTDKEWFDTLVKYGMTIVVKTDRYVAQWAIIDGQVKKYHHVNVIREGDDRGELNLLMEKALKIIGDCDVG